MEWPTPPGSECSSGADGEDEEYPPPDWDPDVFASPAPLPATSQPPFKKGDVVRYRSARMATIVAVDPSISPPA